ncbi:MAG: M6 family metalloprotease domain-containing protein [Prevotella sp.]
MNQQRLLLILYLSIASILCVSAAKARQGQKKILQSDGTTIEVNMHGDEFFHYYTANDGTILTMVDNCLYIAQQSDDGTLISTGVLAHEPEKRNLVETLAVQQQDRDDILQSGIQKAMTVRSNFSTRSNSAPNLFPSKGSPRAIVILVEFTDQSFLTDDPKNSFDNFLNSMDTYPQQTKFNNFSSVKRYYSDMSFGQFTPQFDLYGPYKLNNKYKTYGQYESISQLVTDACEMADNDIDFSKYDNDSDGYVDLVYIIYAGYGENSPGNSSDCIWPCSGTMTSITKDGINICRYGCNNELYGDMNDTATNTLIDGIGVFCHEFAHCLGLPDIYPTGYTNNKLCCNVGLGYYGLMDMGEYTYLGYRPTALNCWERHKLGWIDIEELSTAQVVKLETLEKGGKAYKITNEANPNEYYMLEQIDNTDNTLWNRYLFNNGMLIYHIDYDETIFSVSSILGNRVNSEMGHPRFSLVAADGLMLNNTFISTTISNTGNSTIDNINEVMLNRYNGQTIDANIYKSEAQGDPFPGTSGCSSFTDISFPSAYWFTGGNVGKPITEITQDKNGDVSFCFMGGTSEIENDLSSEKMSSSFYSIDGKYVGNDRNMLHNGLYVEKGKKKFFRK